jgi:NAD(P)-dependent dehydrogenase (short-subunit alcohol dehydrogenase family)
MSLKYTLDFTDKTVIVTGAAGGLGLVLAQAFYANGANVVVTDVSDERLAKCPELFPKDTSTASESGETNGEEKGVVEGGEEKGVVEGGEEKGRFLAIKCDSSSETEVAALIETVTEKFGELDVLVNNAAVNDDMEPAGDCGMEMWERNIKVFDSPFLHVANGG